MARNQIHPTLVLAFTALIAAATPATAQPASFTTLSGRSQPATVALAAPACPAGEQFLVSYLQASPDVLSQPPGFLTSYATARWAVVVPLKAQDGTIVQLTAIGRGVVHVETSLPAGQALPPPGTTLKLIIQVLDPVIATSTARPTFNFHVTGFCGVP